MKTAALTLFATITLLAGSAPVPAPAPPRGEPMRVVQQFKPGGAGGWDYLTFDGPGGRLFFGRGDRVMALDAATGKLLGEIPGTAGVHGVALAPELKRGFTSNGRADSVTVFDLASLKIISEVKVTGANPDAIVYDPFTRAVFTFNGRGNNATVIDAATLKIVATLPLGGTPEFAVSDGGGKIFVNIEDTGEIVTIDAKALKVLTRWSLAPCAEPSGLAMDVAHARLFSVCNNKKLMVTDAHSGRRVAELPIGEGPDAAAFDPARGLVFSSNREGSLTVIHEDDPDHYRVIATVPTRKSARTMALDPATHRIYLAAAEFGPAPAPTASAPRPRPAMLPDSFVILVVADN